MILKPRPLTKQGQNVHRYAVRRGKDRERERDKEREKERERGYQRILA